MDGSSDLLIWILVVSTIVVLTLLGGLVTVFWWHQRRLTAQAREWGLHLLQAQEEERQRIANDLHDDVVQRLWSAQLQLSSDGTSAGTTIGGVIRDLRLLARDLYPPALQHLSLARALQELVAGRPDGTAAELTLDCDDTIELPLPSLLSLYRVAQEAVHNACKHSGSMNITLRLCRDASGVTLSIADNGCGFNMNESMVGGFGLRSMRERMALVGGSLLVVSSHEYGTLVTARLPWQ